MIFTIKMAGKSEESWHPSIPGGFDVFKNDFAAFPEALSIENRTLKRALTDPRRFSGINNAYSDEVLHASQLSPITHTNALKPEGWEMLTHSFLRCYG